MRRLALFLLSSLSLSLTACSDDAAPNPTTPPKEALVPETTKVSDAETRAALSSFDLASGTLRFSRSTSVLATLRAGDVLVSEPSTAAPNGYLRKVTSVRIEGIQTVVETTQASLTDAIHEGVLDATGDLMPEDLQTATADVKGLEVGSRPQGWIGTGDGFRFQANFNETVIDFQEGDVKVKVQVSGGVYFNAGYNVGIEILGINPLKGRFLPELVRAEASIGFDQWAKLRVSGEANAGVAKVKKVAEYRYSPKCFFVGPVPICVVPTVYLFVGASGQVNFKFDYGVSQTAKAQIGARWTDKKGWETIDPTPSFEGTLDQRFDVGGAMKAKAYAKSEGALMLYGLAGPTIGMNLGLELDAAVPRNPFWIARGNIDTYYSFIVDFPIFGRIAESRGDIYKKSFELGRSQNKSPQLDDLSVSVNGFFGHNFEFKCTASDPEDGVPEVTWTSNLSGEIGKGTQLVASLPYGNHTITAVARDSNGATASRTTTLAIENKPPQLVIDQPGLNAQNYVGSTWYLDAYSYDSETGKALPDANITWSSNVEGVLATGSFAPAILRTLGTHTLTATAVDADGARTTASVNVNVMPVPPDGAPPTCYIKADHEGYTSGAIPIGLTGFANDAEDGPLYADALEWRFVSLKGGITADAPVAYGTHIDTTLRGAGDFQFVLTVTDSKHKTGTCAYEGAVRGLR